MNSASRGLAADGRPAPTGRVSFASAEADAWREAPWKADFNRRESLRPAVGPGRRMNSASGGLAADGRPVPTGRVSFASAEADAWRAAPWKADFNRRESLRPTVGPGRRMNSASRGLAADGRPAPTGRVSFASAEADARREAPKKADFNRRERCRIRGGEQWSAWGSSGRGRWDEGSRM
jgi:hypothetical protein